MCERRIQISERSPQLEVLPREKTRDMSVTGWRGLLDLLKEDFLALLVFQESGVVLSGVVQEIRRLERGGFLGQTLEEKMDSPVHRSINLRQYLLLRDRTLYGQLKVRVHVLSRKDSPARPRTPKRLH